MSDIYRNFTNYFFCFAKVKISVSSLLFFHRLDTTNVEESFSAANTSTPVREASSSSAPEAKEMV